MTRISQRVAGGGIAADHDMNEWPREGGRKRSSLLGALSSD